MISFRRTWPVPAILAGLVMSAWGLTHAVHSASLPVAGTVPRAQVQSAAHANIAVRPTPVPAVPTTKTGTRPRRVTARLVAQPQGSQPTRVVIPALGIDAAAVPVLTDPSGGLAVPADPSFIGWWSAGSRPGSRSGTVVVAGHVDTEQDGPGAFYHLAESHIGTVITIMTTTHGKARYTVRAIRPYRKLDLPRDIFDRSGLPRLVLITCGGAFDRKTLEYTDNVVVYATPVS